jgi:hypothetical protein
VYYLLPSLALEITGVDGVFSLKLNLSLAQLAYYFSLAKLKNFKENILTSAFVGDFRW